MTCYYIKLEVNGTVSIDQIAFEFPECGCGFVFDEERPIFRIALAPDAASPAREVLPADFGQVKRSDSRGETRLVFEGLSGEALRVTVRLRRAEGEVLAGIEIESGERAMVREVKFPYLVCKPVHSFDHLLMPTPWGDNIERPTRTLASRPERSISYIYPSTLAMQYISLHCPSRCFYLSNYSLSDESFELGATSLDDDQLAIWIKHYPFTAGGVWKSPECGFSALPGGWHGAADLYRSRMGDKFRAPDLPDWMREGFHGWVQVGMGFEGGKIKRRFSDLPATFERVKKAGFDVMHVYGWAGHGFDTKYPEYDVNPALGTVEEFREALDAIRSMGGRTILYINGRLVDPSTGFYRRGGKDAVCLREDGSPYLERYGTSVSFRIACPACEIYREQIEREVCRIVQDYRADAIQIDQISCNPGFLCFDSRHPHPTPATNFLPGVLAMLARLRKVHKFINPEFFTWCEGCHERYGQFYDVNQGHGEAYSWQMGESLPEQFKYTYPSYVVTGLCTSLQRLCHAYAQGKPFDLPIEYLDDAEIAATASELVALRKAYPEYFVRGVFRDSAGLEVSQGARAYLIERADGGGKLVNVWVPGTEPGVQSRASFRLLEESGMPQAVYPANVTLARDGDWFEARWRGPVATLMFA